jgi:hypothetical protein
LSILGMDALVVMEAIALAAVIALVIAGALMGWLTLSSLNSANADPVSAVRKASALARAQLGELARSAAHSAAQIAATLSHSRETAAAMNAALAQEREAILQLNSEVRDEAETIALSITRHTRTLREASLLVKTEIAAAEAALDQRMAAFAAAAATMREHGAAFANAAESADAASTLLNGKVASMLDGLSQTTQLTEAARQSADAAVFAANETAQALRETTRGAVAEAKQAAQLIRAENAALRDAADDIFAKLEVAAKAARDAAQEAQAAADRHARNAASLASPITLEAAAQAAAVRWSPRAPEPVEAPQPRSPLDAAHWGARLAPTPARDQAAKPANDAGAYDLMDFAAPPLQADAALKRQAIDLVAAAGLDLGHVFRPGDLNRIAHCSRQGAQARRKAVLNAAPEAVRTLSRFVARNGAAQTLAADLRARPDLANGQKGAEIVRAYLLIDAALA